jgi:hypothetical protein
MENHFAVLIVWSGNPLFRQWVVAHHELVSSVMVFFWLLMMRCGAMDTTDLERVLGQAVNDALHLARLTPKFAADAMRWDEKDFYKAMRGERHMDLTRLCRLPFSFWLFFSPTLLYLVAKKHATEVAEDLGFRHSA